MPPLGSLGKFKWGCPNGVGIVVDGMKGKFLATMQDSPVEKDTCRSADDLTATPEVFDQRPLNRWGRNNHPGETGIASLFGRRIAPENYLSIRLVSVVK